MHAFPSLLGRSSLKRQGRGRSLLHLPIVRLVSTGKEPADMRVYGAGINDGPRVLGYRPGAQQLDPNGEIINGKGDCPYYRRWYSMLQRCYSHFFHDKQPTYIGCSVCEEWLTFSKFRAWMVQHDGHWEGKYLSHSVLSRDNKVYSPETCFFATREIVSLFNESAGARGDSPLGVHWSESAGKYQALLNVEGTQKHIGYYDTEAEAHRAWLPHKRAYVLLKVDKHLPAGVPHDARLRDVLIARAHSEYAIAELEIAPLAAAAGPPFAPPFPLLSPSGPQQSAPLCTSAEEERPSKQGGAGGGTGGKVAKEKELVYGVGINDMGYLLFKKTRGPDGKMTTWRCLYYDRWRHMLERCYSAEYLDRHPTYIGCRVCEEWLTFSKFRAWMVQHDGHWEGTFLSHSVLSRDNKVYSPETCFFVTRDVVMLFTDNARARGDSPLGVHWDESSGKYRAMLNVEGTGKFIGRYDTAAEAHRAWLPHKRAYVLLKIDKHLPAGVPYHALLRDFLIARAHSEYADVEPAPAPVPALAFVAGPPFPPPSLQPSPLLSPSSPQQSAPLCTSAEEERPSKQGGAGVGIGGNGGKVAKELTLVYGLGINDAGYQVYVTTRGPNGKMTTWICPYYRRWQDMLTRCYSAKYQDRQPTYIGCSVCEEWLTFSKFRAWMVQHDGHWDGTHLSHSVLSRDNKVYSPETCFFVTRDVVNLFTERAGARGDSPLGVHWSESAGKYRALLGVEGTRKFIGYYDTEAEAHRAWLPHKRAYVLLKIDKHLPAGVPYHALLRDFLIARAHSEYADVEPAPAPVPAAAGPPFPPPSLQSSPLVFPSSPQQSAPLCTSAEEERPLKQGGAGVGIGGNGGKVAKERKLVYGVGINDGGYQVKVTTRGSNGKMTTWRCPYYRRWENMLERCYSAALHDRHPTYIGCSVCEEWLTFSRFRAWMVRHDGHWEGTYLSHSVLSRGNKVYSPETCFFVTREIVHLFNESAAIRGDSPLGVCWDESNGKYKASHHVEGTMKHIGHYDTAAEAHRAWLPHKRAYVLLKIDKHLPAGVPYHARLRDFLIARAHSEYADVGSAPAPAFAVAAM